VEKTRQQINDDRWLRMVAIAFALLVAYEIFALASQVRAMLPVLRSQVVVPYGINSWTDQPI
jgi:hypothetical protein